MFFNRQPFLVFAPMATVSHAGFRHLVEDWGGCDLYFTEMIDAASHLSGRGFEAHYADASPCPEKVVYQIVGADADALVAAAESLVHRDCFGIDVNMGCSAPLIFRHGAGIAWMSALDKAARLVSRLRAVVGPRSLSMKLRLGEEEDEEKLVAFVRTLESEGADFVTLHPRTRRDALSRPARWSWVSLLRQAVTIPVLGNGDLNSFRALRTRADQTPADGYMVGRRAVAAPWSFRLWAGRWSDPSYDFEVDLPAVCLRFHDLVERWQPRDFWVTRSRRFYAYFGENLAFGHRWSSRLQNIRDYDSLKKEALSYWEEQPQERRVLASTLERL